MANGPFRLIDEARASTVDAAIDGGRVRLAPDVLRRALGWELKPEGLCRDAVCVPVRGQGEVVNDRGVDLAAFAALLSRPLALDVTERVACLGASAAERGLRLASLEAPDFTLPDLDGRMHSLSDYRGRKVLLVAYASW
jgi:hypothetical protein